MLPADQRLPVGVLGATGAVGQRFVEMLENHPIFIVARLGASEGKMGKKYSTVVHWRITSPMPNSIAQIELSPTQPQYFKQCVLVFSALDNSVAGEIEKKFAREGIPVFTNARYHRDVADVPILLPFVNPTALELIRTQPSYQEKGGFIVANGNCATTGLCIALKPIMDAFDVISVMVNTMQAASGAGYPGVPSMDLLDNVVPYIKGEEERLEIEPRKIFNKPISISASCSRVPVSDGHLTSVAVKLKKPANLEDVKKVFANFGVAADVANLPSCPNQVVLYREEPDRPQPRLDRGTGNGMTTVIGRIRKCPILDLKFYILSHNTVIGAAGGSILNAELALQKGHIRPAIRQS